MIEFWGLCTKQPPWKRNRKIEEKSSGWQHSLCVNVCVCISATSGPALDRRQLCELAPVMFIFVLPTFLALKPAAAFEFYLTEHKNSLYTEK